MNIGIVGYGYVGQAMAHLLDVPDNNIQIVDPKYSELTISDLVVPSFVFICVPTPSNEDGSCDYSIVLETTKQVMEHHPTTILVVKSTVTPNAIDALLEIAPDLVYSPEFLTAANSLNDVVNSKFQLIGNTGENGQYLSFLYTTNSRMQSFFLREFVTPQEAAFAKYTINSFLAVKVAYMNELYALAQTLNVDWQRIVDQVQLDPRIGKSHMQVPGPDGEFGFGGACFPKDTQALAALGDMPILNTVIAENKRRRDGQ